MLEPGTGCRKDRRGSSQTRPTLLTWHSGGRSRTGLAGASTYAAAPPQRVPGRFARQAACSLSPHASPAPPPARRTLPGEIRAWPVLPCHEHAPDRSPAKRWRRPAPAVFLCDLKQVHIIGSFLSLKIWVYLVHGDGYHKTGQTAVPWRDKSPAFSRFGWASQLSPGSQRLQDLIYLLNKQLRRPCDVSEGA